jgi:hypothetical protein
MHHTLKNLKKVSFKNHFTSKKKKKGTLRINQSSIFHILKTIISKIRRGVEESREVGGMLSALLSNLMDLNLFIFSLFFFFFGLFLLSFFASHFLNLV